MTTIRIGARFQGPTGTGHGGWTAYKFVEEIGQPATVAIRAPIPTDTDLTIDAGDNSWLLVDKSGPAPRTILEATRWEPIYPATEPVTIHAARAARARFPLADEQHPVPFCFSCGLQEDSMRVHAGLLGDGRFATDWQVPDWAINNDADVEDGALWGALDCAAAWFVSLSAGIRLAYTVQFAAEVLEPLEVEEHYSLVAWSGVSNPGWEGRKRGAASAAFAEDGTCVARSISYWVAIL